MEYNLHTILLGLINTSTEKLFKRSEKEKPTGTINIDQESVQESVCEQNGTLCEIDNFQNKSLIILGRFPDNFRDIKSIAKYINKKLKMDRNTNM